jgi:hypothetical protein
MSNAYFPGELTNSTKRADFGNRQYALCIALSTKIVDIFVTEFISRDVLDEATCARN